MQKRAGFTLIEVLISIALLGLIIPALYQTVDLLQDSNEHLKEHLYKSRKETQATQTLFLDIASSDGNLTITNGEYDRLCIEQTHNSLYGLSVAKVCWVVLKHEHTLVRVEGSRFHLPVALDERVAVDPLMKQMVLFDLYWEKDKALVMLQQKGKEPVAFMVQGITKPKPKKKQGKKPPRNEANTTRPPSSPAPFAPPGAPPPS
ncbi:MAG: prepilin-type N-terminal cleavage/methylation domain-containing protein [Sulfurovum sp.]|nr:prepilin-type N-terminal cleavage/methylation domain-containing protein [Sulfurovum sp.]